jgi:hypothetical protein
MNDESSPPPPPPPPEDQSPEPLAPAPERDAFSPVKESRGSRALEVAGRGCLGVVSFLLAAGIFMIVISAHQAIGLIVSIAMFVGLMAWRSRSGPSPMLGAVVVGAGIALLLTGTCTLIVMNL